MSATTADYRTPKAWLILAAFIVVVSGVGYLIGTQTQPGAWFEQLQKPPLMPPDWLFAPVWSVLYILIAIAGWRTWMDDPKSTAMKFWIAQMILNWAWSPIWFGAEMPWLAFAVIVAMWLTILGYILSVRERDPVAAWLFAPYLAWVSFATYLNLSIALLN